MMRWIERAVAAVLVAAVAGCAAPQMAAEPELCPPSAAPPIVLAVGRVTVDGSVRHVAPAALPLAQAALLGMQQRLRAAGGPGSAHFLLRAVGWTEEAAPGADGLAPATRREGRIRYAVELRDTVPPPAPVEGEARSVMIMLGHASPAEAAWACQQVSHETVERMARDLDRQLAPWRLR